MRHSAARGHNPAIRVVYWSSGLTRPKRHHPATSSAIAKFRSPLHSMKTRFLPRCAAVGAKPNASKPQKGNSESSIPNLFVKVKWQCYTTIKNNNETSKKYTHHLCLGSYFLCCATISGSKAVVVGGSDWMELIISVVASDTGHKMKKERAYLARLTGGAWSWINTYLDCTKFFNKIKDVLK